jgi:hypothetical protein
MSFNSIDRIKANRRGNREAELENSNGWCAIDKPHKNKKKYTRKSKHKKSYL